MCTYFCLDNTTCLSSILFRHIFRVFSRRAYKIYLFLLNWTALTFIQYLYTAPHEYGLFYILFHIYCQPFESAASAGVDPLFHTVGSTETLRLREKRFFMHIDIRKTLGLFLLLDFRTWERAYHF